jgi:CcmD family protein
MKKKLGSLLLVLVVLGAVAAAGQPAPSTAAPDGFVPVSSLPPGDQLPAAPMLIAAYAVVWAALMVYVWSLWRRMSRLERELADLTRRVKGQ